MSLCDDDESMKLGLEIIDSLHGFVGDKITPELLEVIREVCASHLREQDLPLVSPSDVLNRMARRRDLPEEY